MMASGRLVDYLGAGTAAARPASLTLTTGSIGIYFATDTSAVSYWTGSAWVTAAGGGTVTSVGLSLPADLTVSNSPVTSAGTLTAVRANQNANLFLAGPSSGAAGAPGYRAISANDFPSTVATLTNSAGTVNIDWSNIYSTLTLAANVTTLTYSNIPASGIAREIRIDIVQNATGGFTFALPAAWKAIGNSDTAIQSAANAKTTIILSTTDGGTTYPYVMAKVAP